MMIFLARYWREAAIGVLLLVAMTAWHAHDVALVERGRALEKVRVADSALAVLKPALAHTDTVLVRDTVRVTRLATSLQTIHDTVVTHLTDTVLVKQFITASDSAIRACTDLLGSCAVFRAQANATIAALEVKVAAVPVLALGNSCRAASVGWALIGAGAGFLGGRLAR